MSGPENGPVKARSLVRKGLLGFLKLGSSGMSPKPGFWQAKWL